MGNGGPEGPVLWRVRSWASGLWKEVESPESLTSLGSPDPVSILCSSSSPMSGCGSGLNTSSNSGTYSTWGSKRTCKGHSADIRRPGRKCGRLVVVANTRSDWHVPQSRGRGQGELVFCTREGFAKEYPLSHTRPKYVDLGEYLNYWFLRNLGSMHKYLIFF